MIFIYLKNLILNKEFGKLLSLLCILYILIVLLVLITIGSYYDDDLNALKHGERFNTTNHETDCYFQSDYCFNIYRCVNFVKDCQSPLKVYIYKEPFGDFSLEFKELVETILYSEYYESNPKKACLFIPLIDLTNEFNLIDKKKQVELYIKGLKYWSNGKNHFLFNMISIESKLSIWHQSAIISGSSFETDTYRKDFDVSVPMFNTLTAKLSNKAIELSSFRRFRIVSTQINLSNRILNTLKHSKNVSLFKSCLNGNYFKRCLLTNHSIYSYPTILSDSLFCFVFKTDKKTSLMSLFDAIKSNCIPIIVSSEWILPFSEHLDWRQFSIQINLKDLNHLEQILSYHSNNVNRMLFNLDVVYTNYFKSIKVITLAILKQFERKIYPINSNETQIYFQTV